MNPVIDAIASRRTVKKIDPERTPPRGDIETLIEAATWAPNHHMTEPWRFIVLEKGARRRLGEALAAAMDEGTTPQPPERLAKEREKPLSAPVVIAIIGSPKKGEGIVPQEEMVAAGAAMQNMLLAAHSMGLAAAVRTGAHSYSSRMKSFFGMGPEESLVALVYVGYANGVVAPGKRTPAGEKTSWLDE
jgi:nitroreductase